jgi:hypothetical protein
MRRNLAVVYGDAALVFESKRIVFFAAGQYQRAFIISANGHATQPLTNGEDKEILPNRSPTANPFSIANFFLCRNTQQDNRLFCRGKW